MLIVTDHAAQRLTDRRIALSWVKSTLTDPEWNEPDPQPGLVRSFAPSLRQAGGCCALFTENLATML
jgi:hypothetical protein